METMGDKFEIQNQKFETNSKPEIQNHSVSNFGFRICFEFSYFEF